MTEMISFCQSMLTALCEFLITPPIFYLFGLVCFCFVCKGFKILISH